MKNRNILFKLAGFGFCFLLIGLVMIVAEKRYIQAEPEKENDIIIGKSILITDDLYPEVPFYRETILSSYQDMDLFLEGDENLQLLFSNNESEIKVYGIKEIKGASYYLRGICVECAEQKTVFDIAWGVYGEIPQFAFFDFDQDGQNELGMITRSAQGTGIAMNDLYIFEFDHNVSIMDCFTYSDMLWIKDLNSLLGYKIYNDKIIIELGENRDIVLDREEIENELDFSIETISYTTYGNFEFEDGTIYLYSKPFAKYPGGVTYMEIMENDIRFEVRYNEGFTIK